ncbi:hypothetical protein [Microbispora triticiradicis]|uniref:hypothetical protein n=1 Tax=Microbispora triticiradicis TaxID=2200763 RepID=UPI001AD6DE49|nr:hypothetical protein [Microbispora triticiradicis]MBO4271066.1 hypothetical protein [Microbispora triticiradicis]
MVLDRLEIERREEQHGEQHDARHRAQGERERPYVIAGQVERQGGLRPVARPQHVGGQERQAGRPGGVAHPCAAARSTP